MFLISLICTIHCRIPLSTSTHQGPKKGDLIPLLEDTKEEDVRTAAGVSLPTTPSEWDQIVLFKFYICITSRQIPASASKNQGLERGNFIPLLGRLPEDTKEGDVRTAAQVNPLLPRAWDSGRWG